MGARLWRGSATEAAAARAKAARNGACMAGAGQSQRQNARRSTISTLFSLRSARQHVALADN